ncbi:hypothetical protein [Sorangium sp. So ce887]|uniref:hypothetical protein n=1 Tax=Sorangium sp. So ce887 TaxID=3133324 RepID=UPI003F60D491
MVSTVADLKTAAEVTEWTAARLDNFTEDLEILQELRIEPHHLIERVRAADGARVYLLHPHSCTRSARWVSSNSGSEIGESARTVKNGRALVAQRGSREGLAAAGQEVLSLPDDEVFEEMPTLPARAPR